MSHALRRHPAVNPYARALLQVGLERQEAVEYEEELRVLATEVFGEGTLKLFFESPKIPRTGKKKALDQALGGKVSGPVLNLIKILIDRGRQEIFEQIADAYAELHDEHRGRVHVKIVTTMPIGLDLQQELIRTLKDRLQKEIVAVAEHDEELVGGMTVQIGDTVIDGSVRTRLNRVREAMSTHRLGSDLFDES